MLLRDILKDSSYKLTQFTQNEIDLLEGKIELKEVRGVPVPYVKCLIRKKAIKLTPEEVVRQLFLSKLMLEYQYPEDRIQLEYAVSFGREKKRSDICKRSILLAKKRPLILDDFFQLHNCSFGL